MGTCPFYTKIVLHANPDRHAWSPNTRWEGLSHLLLVSLFFLVHYSVSGDEENRKAAIPYLGICGGLFGKLSLENNEASYMDYYLELMQAIRAN